VGGIDAESNRVTVSPFNKFKKGGDPPLSPNERHHGNNDDVGSVNLINIPSSKRNSESNY
jgi:hypothetical protein